jgi:hypothetical protein
MGICMAFKFMDIYMVSKRRRFGWYLGMAFQE